MAEANISNFTDIISGKIKKDISSRGLRSLDEVKIPPETEILILDYNRFIEFPKQICDLRGITVLSIANQIDMERLAEYSKPALQKLPDNVYYLSSLAQLFLWNNALCTLPASMWRMENLQVLDLRMNNITTFPECICEMKHLLILRLCGNKLTSLPERIYTLSLLRELSVVRNNLKSLPSNLCRMTSLEKLNLQKNDISHLPSQLHQLNGLLAKDGLLLDHNPLQFPPMDVVKQGTRPIFQYLRDNSTQYHSPWNGSDKRNSVMLGVEMPESELSSVSGFKYPNDTDLSNKKYNNILLSAAVIAEKCPGVALAEIERLNVSGNNIESLDTSLRNLSSLDTLILDDNCIVRLFPLPAIKCMKRLRKLALNRQGRSQHLDSIYGRLKVLPLDMIFIKHLTHLHMASNEICVIPDEIEHMVNLIELDLMDNTYISKIPDGIRCLTKLNYLGLSYNSIDRVPAAIGKLKELRVLRLSHNKLQELPEEMCQLNNLITLSLSDNQLVCLPYNFDKLTSLASNQFYVSDLIKGKFPSRLKVDNNENIRFPSADCQSMTAAQIFDDYSYYREHEPETMLERYKRAKSSLQTYEGQWKFLTNNVFVYLSTKMGDEWKRLGYCLGLCKADLDQCRENHHTLADVIIEMLTRWRDMRTDVTKPEEAMVRELEQTMSEIQQEHLRDLFTDYIVKHCGWKN